MSAAKDVESTDEQGRRVRDGQTGCRPRTGALELAPTQVGAPEVCLPEVSTLDRSTLAPPSSGLQSWALWLVAAGVCLGLGCARPHAPVESAPALVETAPTAEGGEGAAPSADAREALPVIDPATDTSLELAVYRAAGIPEVDRAWGARDYERCLAVFADLLRSGRSDLPRRGSPRSGALFSRVVSVDNFASAAEAAPVERARRLQSYIDVYPGLLQVYSPANDGIDFSVEQTELIVSLFELLKLALESSRAVGSEAPGWADVYARQQQMTLGVARGASAMLAEPERYAPPLRHYLEAALVRLAPDFERHLDPNAARELHALAASASPDSEPPR